MKRWWVKLIVFLVLGAIVNVVVAWSFSCLPSPKSAVFFRMSHGPTFVSIRQGVISIYQEGPGVNSYWSFGRHDKSVDEQEYRLLIPKWSAFSSREPAYESTAGRANDIFGFSEVGCGWPLYTVRGSSVSRFGTRLIHQSTWQLEIPPQSMLQNKRPIPLPYQPIWPNFAINTIFYGAVLWLPVTAVSVLRRKRRIKRGLCPACAYPVGVSEVCTECGTAVISRRLR